MLCRHGKCLLMGSRRCGDTEIESRETNPDYTNTEATLPIRHDG